MLDHRIAVEGHDELAMLSAHFNQMAEQLEVQHRALVAQQGQLERKVSERTAQLESANRRLKDLDRLRILFLADVSHELRTPLTVLRGEAEVTLRSRAARVDDYRETLEGVVDQAEQMGRLVDDLLFLTRAEAEFAPLRIRAGALQDVIGEALTEGRVLAGSNGHQLIPDYPREPLVVTADRQRLKQTALIAIDNAIKYSHPRLARGGRAAGRREAGGSAGPQSRRGHSGRGSALCLRALLPGPPRTPPVGAASACRSPNGSSRSTAAPSPWIVGRRVDRAGDSTAAR